MAPDKFEKYVKDKVRQREITPSDDAWNRIAEQLPVVEKSGRKPIVWYSIAASFIGILIITLYFTQTTTPDLVSPTPVVISEENDPASITPLVESEKEPIVTEEGEAVASQPSTRQNTGQMPSVKVAETVTPVGDKTLEAPVVPNTAVVENIIPEEAKQQELFIESKVAEVVAEVRLLEQNNEALTEAEVDSLLRRAQNELLKERLFKTDNTVDAVALLNEVETELDQSFRDQIFDRLKTGFMKVRTALADRNN